MNSPYFDRIFKAYIMAKDINVSGSIQIYYYGRVQLDPQRVTKEMDVGTHTIFVGEVVNADVVSDEVCMTYDYYHQIKGGKTPKAAATYIEERKVEEKKEVKPGMTKYRCTVCGYIYDPEKGDPDGNIKPATPFESIPDDWVCPVCGADKSEFEPVE